MVRSIGVNSLVQRCSAEFSAIVVPRQLEPPEFGFRFRQIGKSNFSNQRSNETQEIQVFLSFDQREIILWMALTPSVTAAGPG